MEIETKHVDRTILLLKRKLQEDDRGDEWRLGSKPVTVRPEQIGAGITMLMPELFHDMDKIKAQTIYPRKNRPKVIKTNQNNTVTVTFQVTGQERPAEIMAADVCHYLVKTKPQYVFYERDKRQGKQTDIFWFDFKGFGIDRMFYCLIFICDIGKWNVTGNFHCDFKDYVNWKPLILKLVQTISVDGSMETEEKDERLSN